jgi:hypothetical protein
MMMSAHRHGCQIPIRPGISVFSETAGTERSARLDEGIEMDAHPLKDDSVVTRNQFEVVAQQTIRTPRSQASQILQGLKIRPKANQSQIPISTK